MNKIRLFLLGLLVVGCSRHTLMTPVESTTPTATVHPAPTSTMTPAPIILSPAIVWTPSPTAAPATNAETFTPESTADSPIESVIAPLHELPLETFFEASFYQLQLRDPDMLIEYPECYDVRHNSLPNLSDAYIRETQQLELAILDLLHSYDRTSLPSNQQLSYAVYEWYLDDLVRGHEFMYADLPITGYGEWDLANRLVAMTLALPIADRQDAEDYIDRLSQVGVWSDQLLEGLRIREQAGVIPPKFLLEDARLQIEGHMQMQSPGVFDVDAIALYTSFDAQLKAVSSLSAQEKQTLRQAARTEIEQTFIPAFTELREYLLHLQSIAPDDAGLSSLPNGAAYYAYLLRRYTGAEVSAEELHAMGLSQVARLQAEMQQAAVDLGYAPGLSMAAIAQILDENRSPLEGEALLVKYERLLAEAKSSAGDFFQSFPTADVIVTYDPAAPVAGYYQNPPIDGSGPGMMVTNLQDPGTSTLYNYIVLLNHETLPGHHVQQALALDLNLPAFRSTLCSDFYLKDLEYQGYVEGWALYAQQLGWEMGLYGENRMENLGRLRLMLTQVARMVVETGIHAKGWTREAAAAYFESATGRPTTAQQINRYVALPGQAVSYDFGLITILELRQQAIERLGSRFDIKEFHEVILGNGPMPVGFLEKMVQDWIAATLSVGTVISVDTVDQVERLHTLSGHSDKVIDLVFSEDGTYAASSSLDRTIKVWAVENWHEVHAFSMNKAGFNGIALSPDGRLLASADAIWDVESKQVVHVLERNRNDPGPVAFSPDGSLLAVALESQPIKLWNVASGEVLRTFEEPANDVTFSIAFSPDGKRLAAGVHGGIVRLWDVERGKMVGTLEHGGENDDVHELTFSPNGEMLASAGNDNTVRLWDVASGQVVHILRHGNGLYGVAFSPDGRLVAAAGCDRTVKLWDVESGKMLRSLPHADEVMTVTFSPDGTLLISGGYDNIVYVWGLSHTITE